MARNRSKSATHDTAGAPSTEEWKALLPTGLLVGSVVLTLLLAAAWQLRGPAARIDPRPSVVETQPLVDGGGEQAFSGLAQRAARDRGRLAASAASWTLQVNFACDPDNVEAQTRALAQEADFFLLATGDDDRDCFRFCWGVYDSRDQAVAQRSFPAAVAQMDSRPFPMPVEQALQ